LSLSSEARQVVDAPRLSHSFRPDFFSIELLRLSISIVELARQLHVPSNRMYALISDKRAMTADNVLRL